MNTYDNRDLIKICSKNDVVLQKNKINKNFIINFFIENKNIDISKVIDFSIYKLIGELNQDVLENIEIIKLIDNDSECHMLFLFKQLSKELGISKKYMFLKTIKTIENDTIIFKSYDLDATTLNINVNLNSYEKIYCETSTIMVSVISPYLVKINYIFNMDLNEDLPIYLQNILGLLMKKMFYKLKLFIEMAK
jgi:hypothetical protein